MNSQSKNDSVQMRHRVKVAVTMYADDLGVLSKLPVGLLDRLANQYGTPSAAIDALDEFLRPPPKPKPKAKAKPKRKREPRPGGPRYGGDRALKAAGRDYIAGLSIKEALEFQDGGEANDIAVGITGQFGVQGECNADVVHIGMMAEQERIRERIEKAHVARFVIDYGMAGAQLSKRYALIQDTGTQLLLLAEGSRLLRIEREWGDKNPVYLHDSDLLDLLVNGRVIHRI